MKKAIPIVIVIGMLGWAIFEFVNSSSGAADEVGLERGKVAPDFEVTTLEGEQVKLSDFRGERVMLNFWATWCPPCRAEMPDMQKVYEEEDVTILAVNMTETEINEEVVSDFVDELDLTFPILMDEESDVTFSYKIQAYPTSYMIDTNGRIQFITYGPMNHEQMMQQFNSME